MDPQGRQKRQLLRGAKVGQFGGTWSPDGRRIAFVQSPGRLAVVNADGSGLRYLPAPRYPMNPVWSLDGSRLAVTSFDDQSTSLYTIAVSGKSAPQLIS